MLAINTYEDALIVPRCSKRNKKVAGLFAGGRYIPWSNADVVKPIAENVLEVASRLTDRGVGE